MAQVTDYNIANASGASVRSDLNSVFSAIKTLNSGSSDPANTEAFMPYVDTGDNNNLKIRNASNNGFTTIGPVNETNLGLLPKAGGAMTGQFLADNGGTESAPAISFNGDIDTGLFRSAANQLSISTGGTKRWNFLSDGSLITLGTTINTALTTAGAAFYVNNNKFNGLALVKDDNGWGTPLFINRLNPYATGNLVEFQSNNAFCGSINTTTGSTTNFNTNVSDRTLKKNFENWNENTLDLFKSLNPQKYNYLHQEDTAKKDKGFIAQEVVDSFPEAYPQNDKGKYMFNPSGMVVYLMKALQESVAKIETLEAKVAALEAK